jgi:hypothetical protein
MRSAGSCGSAPTSRTVDLQVDAALGGRIDGIGLCRRGHRPAPPSLAPIASNRVVGVGTTGRRSDQCHRRERGAGYAADPAPRAGPLAVARRFTDPRSATTPRPASRSRLLRDRVPALPSPWLRAGRRAESGGGPLSERVAACSIAEDRRRSRSAGGAPRGSQRAAAQRMACRHPGASGLARSRRALVDMRDLPPSDRRPGPSARPASRRPRTARPLGAGRGCRNGLATRHQREASIDQGSWMPNVGCSPNRKRR